MGLFPKDQQRGKAILHLAQEWRVAYFDNQMPVCPFAFLERDIRKEFKDYEFAVESDLRNLEGVRIEGTTTFRPHKRVTMDQVVYDLARRGDGPARFSMFHEAGHLILHHDDPRAENLTQLNRGRPFSGTSFKECPELEKEANLFAGCFMVPITAVHPETTAREISERFVLSIEASERALKVIRAAYPNRWRLR